MGLLNWLFGNQSHSRPAGGDGSSPEQAVIVRSVRAEYRWVQQNCPGYHPESQALMEIGGKPYDLLTLVNNSGQRREVYFDISHFYGRF